MKKNKVSKKFFIRLQHSFLRVSFILLWLGAVFVFGLMYWLLYNLRI